MSCDRCRQGGCDACCDVGCACTCDTPALLPPENPPGQSALAVRLGDYRDFFAAAVDGLSDAERPALRELGTRAAGDATIAWLDAWAVVADVLTFYRERLTNDGYLRTIRDETALRELVALVGFKPRPGVAATAYLAYLLEKTAAPVEIPLLAKAQTVPAPGEQMQTFETEEPFVAHAAWSQMAPRKFRPANITLLDALLRSTLRLSDTALFVRPGERVLFVFDGKAGFQVMREVVSAKVDIQAGYVELQLKARLLLEAKRAVELVRALETLRDQVQADPDMSRVQRGELERAITSFLLGGSATDARRDLETAVGVADGPAVGRPRADLVDLFRKMDELDALAMRRGTESSIENVLAALRRAPSAQVASRRQLSRDATTGLSAGGEDRWALLKATSPEVAADLPAVLDNLPVSGVSPGKNAPTVHLLRTASRAFGGMAPPLFDERGRPLIDDRPLEPADKQCAFLETAVDAVLPDSLVVIDRGHASPSSSPFHRLRVARVRSAQAVSRDAYGISGKASRLELVSLQDAKIGLSAASDEPEGNAGHLEILRNTLYFVQSEPISLAGDEDFDPVAGSELELAVRVDGLQPGQWLIVAGERVDILDANAVPVPGVRAAELAMIGSVNHQPHEASPGDTLHTLLGLAKPLNYSYERASVTVYGNVVKASHGETLNETLGSGDASSAGQRFALKRGPLTFVPAPTVAGVEGSEVIRVNGRRYSRVESLLDAEPTAHAYQLDVDAGGAGTLTFGGARLPSGQQNVRAVYRVGIGVAGNALAKQISLLTTRPLGVSGVVNPLRASGGADRDGPERIRRNAPLAARALGPLARCVSVDDYAALARRFAGIGQAVAVKLRDGAEQVVHVTVAGVDDIPLEPAGELLENLRSTFTKYGDPSYPVEIAIRELKVLMLQAKVTIEADASWDFVEPVLRRRLLDAFGLEQRRLGQSAYLSEVIAVMQRTAGVAWVDVDLFGGVTENDVRDKSTLAAAVASGKLKLERMVVARPASANPAWKPGAVALSKPAVPRFLPAQLAVLLPGVPGLLALNPNRSRT